MTMLVSDGPPRSTRPLPRVPQPRRAAGVDPRDGRYPGAAPNLAALARATERAFAGWSAADFRRNQRAVDWWFGEFLSAWVQNLKTNELVLDDAAHPSQNVTVKFLTKPGEWFGYHYTVTFPAR